MSSINCVILFFKVLDRKIVMVEISIHPKCLHVGQSSKENKASTCKWFTKEHFDVSKLYDSYKSSISFAEQIRKAYLNAS